MKGNDMTVYLIWWYDEWILGAFTSRAKADAWLASARDPENFSVEEFSLGTEESLESVLQKFR